MEIPSISEMLKAGVHFGHRTSRWHPKMKPYIFGERNNIHIINLDITAKKLKEAGEFLRDTVKEGGMVLLVGTKLQAQEIIKKCAEECAMPYVSNSWLGGTLTNFETIRRLIKGYVDLREKETKGELQKYTKKEQMKFKKEIEDKKLRVGGIESLSKLPEVIFILDVKKEKTAFREARLKHIPIVAVCDTNVDPAGIDYVIPANDDAVKSIEFIVGFVAQAIKEGMSLRQAQTQEIKK